MSHWKDFFRPPTGNGLEVVSFRVLRWRGHEWLILPRNASLAAKALVLYPAQRKLAQAARQALKWALRIHLPLELRNVEMSPEAPFVRFLAKCARTLPELPEMAILAGNPHAEGARHTFLIFDVAGNPCAVAKAGIDPAARTLIEREADFLQQHSGRMAGLPRFIGRLASDSISALATKFIGGESPPPKPPPVLADFLFQWVDEGSEVLLETIPAWQRLGRIAPGEPVFAHVRKATTGRVVHSVMWHGDFAPWNIKIDRTGQWTVLDFDRSEPCGVPAWDWLHYVVQAGILIERKDASSIANRIEELLASKPFRQYAQRTGILGIEREITKAYLLYVLYILRPDARTAQLETLMRALN